MQQGLTTAYSPCCLCPVPPSATGTYNSLQPLLFVPSAAQCNRDLQRLAAPAVCAQCRPVQQGLTTACSSCCLCPVPPSATGTYNGLHAHPVAPKVREHHVCARVCVSALWLPCLLPCALAFCAVATCQLTFCCKLLRLIRSLVGGTSLHVYIFVCAVSQAEVAFIEAEAAVAAIKRRGYEVLPPPKPVSTPVAHSLRHVCTASVLCLQTL